MLNTGIKRYIKKGRKIQTENNTSRYKAHPAFIFQQPAKKCNLYHILKSIVNCDDFFNRWWKHKLGILNEAGRSSYSFSKNHKTSMVTLYNFNIKDIYTITWNISLRFITSNVIALNVKGTNNKNNLNTKQTKEYAKYIRIVIYQFLFVYLGLSSLSRIVHSHGDVTIIGEGLQLLEIGNYCKKNSNFTIIVISICIKYNN